MLKKLFSNDVKPGAFFRRLDWTAFWSATAIAFLVYFFTLGPSVGLEDSGELATAGDHLGVPHPPGYPFWTLCSWIFCRLFSFVTYQGQPTPAFAISLLSAVFGALAAGCTAMLITRSASDMLSGANKDPEAKPSFTINLAALAGGLGGSLAFAFSPVEWSQSTIVEIYSLNALFLMFVFLLSYRWMRMPSDKVLWTVAFAFGLGLTNYQVLLLAIVPLAIIIFFRDLGMFRDTMLFMIPVGLTAQALKIGSMFRANQFMQSEAINKLNPVGAILAANGQIVGAKVYCPESGVIYFACAVFVLMLVAAAVFSLFHKRTAARSVAMGGLIAAVIFTGFSFLGGSVREWGFDAGDIAPMIAPGKYVLIALLMFASATFGFIATLAPEEDTIAKSSVWGWLAGSAVAGGIALLICGSITAAGSNGYEGAPFDWKFAQLALVGGVTAMIIITAVFTKRGLAYAIPAAIGQLCIFTLLNKGAMHGLTNPHTWWFAWPIIWNFILLALLAVSLPHGRSIAGAAFFAELGVSFYVYMPIVSDLRNPPMNWGYPRTWEGFKHAIMRGQYEAIQMTPILSGKFVQQLSYYFSDLRMQFTLIAATLALVPFAFWRIVRTKAGQALTYFNAVYLAAGLYLATATVVIISEIKNGEPFDIPIGWLPIRGALPSDAIRSDKLLIVLLGVLILFGLYAIMRRQAIRIGRELYTGFMELEAWKRYSILGMIAIGALGAMAMATMLTVSHVRLIAALEAAGDANAVAMAAWPVKQVFWGLSLLAVMESVHWLMSVIGAKLEYEADDVSQQWLISSGVCFAIMSIFLVALAQVKGDIQDGFIQKVKFISSHAIFAVWIGYGLVLGVKVADSLLAKLRAPAIAHRAVITIAAICASLTFLIPIYENYHNDKLVFAMGSAEQNGHTFGWQFGNYQLRGAEAIREELDAEEEPLPNPLWPEDMEPHSIFFGGTDPGRFVPTYMIYSAMVRPDVYLITQNALADDTYMSVERDLYGDEIWIPSKDDSAKSFEIYADEVKSGKRQANGDLKIENGRMQVTGALGVMEINGILTKMMFDHERRRHSFYVEESYVIPWMYPYLTPHGLIMKINADPGRMSRSIRDNDMEFWDWYWRRLLRDEAFRRDFPAQKSFSKLRAAIAGLYLKQGRFEDGAQAYREAIHLYPASPEASFRYAQEVLIPNKKWDLVTDILDYTDRVDPNNGRTKPFRGWMSNFRATSDRIAANQAKYEAAKKDNKTVEPAMLIQLANDNLQVGNAMHAVQFCREAISNPMLGDINVLLTAVQVFQQCGLATDAGNAAKRASKLFRSNTPAQYVRFVASSLSAANMHEDASSIWASYVNMQPGDFDAIIQLANSYACINKTSQCESALLRALQLDMRRWQEVVGQNERLLRIANPMIQRMQRQQERQRQQNPAMGYGPRR